MFQLKKKIPQNKCNIGKGFLKVTEVLSCDVVTTFDILNPSNCILWLIYKGYFKLRMKTNSLLQVLSENKDLLVIHRGPGKIPAVVQ